ncbi:MAG: AI-2E family transporter [Cyanobacteria bacterium]|nr:AI-2E family transporter [Cyanobacteriota bacterium]
MLDPQSSINEQYPEGSSSLEKKPASFLKLEGIFRLNIILLSLFALLYGLFRLMEFLYDVVAILGGALLLTYLLLGPVNFVESSILKTIRNAGLKPPGFLKKPPFSHVLEHFNFRGISVLVVYLLFFCLIFISSVRVFPVIQDQVTELGRDLPGYMAQFDEEISYFSHSPEGVFILKSIPILPLPPEEALNTSLDPIQDVHLESSQDVPKIQQLEVSPLPPSAEATDANGQSPAEARARTILAQMLGYFQKLGINSLHHLKEVVTTTMEGMIFLVATLVIIFYFLLDGQKLKKGLIDFLPAKIQGKTAHFLENTHNILYTFVKGQIILGLMSGAYLWFIYTAYGVKYSGFLGSFFGASSILPVVGPWLGLIPGVFVILFGDSPLDLMWVLMFTGAWYILKEYWLNRMILGNALEIHPVVFILSFLVAIKMTGPVGLLLSFPLASIVCVSIQYFQAQHPEMAETER